MPASTELAANLFRATQAEEKLRREKITGVAERGRINLIQQNHSPEIQQSQ